MVENRTNKRSSFIFELGAAADDKDKLLKLAHDAIVESPSSDKPSFVERKDLNKSPDSLEMNARWALLKAMTSSNLSTNNKLYLIMERYVLLQEKQHPKISRAKALENFFKDFAAQYPKEYGVKGTQQVHTGMVAHITARSGGNGIV